MRKGIVLLIVALMFDCSVFASKDTVPPAVVATTPTVTLSLEQFDSLIAASAKSDQMELVAKNEAEKKFSDYVNHVGWVVGLFGVLCTILVAIVGVAVPILLNRKFENDIKDKIADHDKQINKTKEEIDEAKKSAEQDAKNAKAYGLFAWARQLGKENKKRTIELYTSAIEEKPDFWEAYCNRGIAYRKRGEYDEAIRDYDQAIALCPQSSDLHTSRGIAYRMKGDYDQAIESFNRAIKLNSQSAVAYNNRGLAYYNKGDHAQAIKDYDQAIKLKPTYAKAYNNRGNAYLFKVVYDQAIKDYDKAIELNPQYALAYNNRGYAYMTRGNDGDYELAMNDFKTGLSLNPDESTRMKLENNMKKLKEKMQKQKKDE